MPTRLYIYSMMKGLFLCFGWLIVDSISRERREVPFRLLVCLCARLIRTENELKSVLSPRRINSKRAKKNNVETFMLTDCRV